MHQRSLILVLLVVATFTGCGKDSDVAQITDLSKQLASDARDKDWKGVCEALSAKARAQITIGGVFLGGGDCAEVVARLAALDDDPEGFGTAGGDDVKVSNVKVTGDRATADVTPTFDDEDPTTRFVREDGEWKVDADLDEEGSSSTTTGDPSDDQTAAAPAPELRVADQGFSRVWCKFFFFFYYFYYYYFFFFYFYINFFFFYLFFFFIYILFFYFILFLYILNIFF